MRPKFELQTVPLCMECRQPSSHARPGARYYVAMSHENVDVVRRALDSSPRGDMEEMLSFMDPEGELHSAIVGGAEGNVYRGHEGFRRWYADSFESFEELKNEWSEFRDLGDRVLAFGMFRRAGARVGWRSPPQWAGSSRYGAESLLTCASPARDVEVAR